MRAVLWLHFIPALVLWQAGCASADQCTSVNADANAIRAVLRIDWDSASEDVAVAASGRVLPGREILDGADFGGGRTLSRSTLTDSESSSYRCQFGLLFVDQPNSDRFVLDAIGVSRRDEWKNLVTYLNELMRELDYRTKISLRASEPQDFTVNVDGTTADMTVIVVRRYGKNELRINVAKVENRE